MTGENPEHADAAGRAKEAWGSENQDPDIEEEGQRQQVHAPTGTAEPTERPEDTGHDREEAVRGR